MPFTYMVRAFGFLMGMPGWILCFGVVVGSGSGSGSGSVTLAGSSSSSGGVDAVVGSGSCSGVCRLD